MLLLLLLLQILLNKIDVSTSYTKKKKKNYHVVDVAPITFIATSICRSFVVKLLDIIAFSYKNSPKSFALI